VRYFSCRYRLELGAGAPSSWPGRGAVERGADWKNFRHAAFAREGSAAVVCRGPFGIEMESGSLGCWGLCLVCVGSGPDSLDGSLAMGFSLSLLLGWLEAMLVRHDGVEAWMGVDGRVCRLFGL
jgi:hypothetical protein